MSERKTIGNLNGKWAILFKATLSTCVIIFPSIIALNVWFVKTIHGIELKQAEVAAELKLLANTGARYTPAMAEAENLRLKQAILEEISRNYPTRREIDSLARRMESVER